MIKVVSFDIGGTLVKVSNEDSVLMQLSAISKVSMDVLRNAYVEHFLKKKITIEQFCDKTNIAKVEDAFDVVNNYYNSKSLPLIYDDVFPALNKIKKQKLLMITISNKSYKNPFGLKSYRLDCLFYKEIYSYDAGYTKPDTNIFRYAEQRIQVKPNEILHVGDSINSDYMGAQKAFWNSIFLCRNQDAAINMYDSKIHVINSLMLLPEYIEKMSYVEE